MSDLQMKLDSLLKKIGIAHLIPNGADGDLNTFVCSLLCVDKVSDLSFQHLNDMSSLLDYIAIQNTVLVTCDWCSSSHSSYSVVYVEH